MIGDAARRSKGVIATLMFVVLTAAACSGVTLPGLATTAPSGANGPGASIGLGTAADLEAALPGQLCGQPTKKSSIAAGPAASDATSSPGPFGPLFGQLSSAGSLQWAVAVPTDDSTCKVAVGAFRVVGLGSALLQPLLSLMAAGSSGEATNTVVGGKQVIKLADEDLPVYIYTKGEVIFAVGAPSDDLAGPVLSALP